MPERTIFIIGAGAIVRDAHVPAYRDARLPIAGIYDPDLSRAHEVARAAGAFVYRSLDALLAASVEADGVIDLAVPPQAISGVLSELPEGSTVLVQKPFGSTLAEATELLAITDRRLLRGAVNFQLRQAPAVVLARRLIAEGAIGEPVDLEVRVVCRMPWETWRFLADMPRMEVLMHSIHYLDLARALFGEPARVWCAVARHPSAPDLADVRSTTTMTFGPMRRAVVSTYHHHAAPPGHDASHLRIEGTRGTIVARLGVNLDYPRGRPDTLEISRDGGAWESLRVVGNWFPEAFAGSMRALQQLANDGEPIESEFRDAWRTMALVEACYKSASGGEPVPQPPQLP